MILKYAPAGRKSRLHHHIPVFELADVDPTFLLIVIDEMRDESAYRIGLTNIMEGVIL